MQIGPHRLRNALFVAPMAGVTDRPFRQLCKRLGAGLAVSEMVSAKPDLRQTRKSRLRTDHEGETEPIAVQIAGADPRMLADAARYNVDRGAQIIDINMGCPAKKVCNLMAGSALLADETLVGRILDAVVGSVDVPVTLKIRTGLDASSRNALRIARIAESTGIRMLSIHGRTRACGFSGEAEYDTIAEVKSASRIPVIANGDIDSPERARAVLESTLADGLMVGRAAQGRPWIFREISHFLATGVRLPPPRVAEIRAVVLEHLRELHDFYGAEAGVRVARKHIGWYVRELPGGEALRQRVNATHCILKQVAEVGAYFERLAEGGERLRFALPAEAANETRARLAA
ncbi:MAG: tRNA dihydrouridine synthase DusB [Betaproteobacteria bacterium]|nr:tRNA dihydrouridine synthase DusB [Betaproteobacteria bacterium]